MMQKWKRESNYMGEDYSDFYILYCHTRDSDPLEESNFRSILQDLSDHPHVSYHLVRFNHWLIGWNEAIMIHQSDSGSVRYGNKILEKLEDYPIFDEEDFSRLEYDRQG